MKKKQKKCAFPRSVWTMGGVFLTLMLGLLGCQQLDTIPFPDISGIADAVNQLYESQEAPAPLLPDASVPPPSNSNSLDDGAFTLHMIDVEQGLAVAAIDPSGACALIDAGERDDGDKLVQYLQGLGVEKIDLLVATHPHADHIGGMEAVLKAFDIGRIIMSTPKKGYEPDTKTYINLLKAIGEKGNKITAAKAGTAYPLGEATLTLTGPAGVYEDLNDISAACRITYGKRSFLVQGDAEKEAEADMLEKGYVSQTDVLIAGHHGSSTSSTEPFLKAVAPLYVGISCGLDNKYGHPHRETQAKLDQLGCEVLRTDISGSVVFSTDGTALEVDLEK